ncbi:SGNH/GDSL hydrolase family protein [Aquipuribacter hungaricus]|uniref:SGNH/GDSL hydrolase family protein n=1 Tax=Aquipuribacter hungaricus TaxID=545624 RepID=UPI0030EE8EDD
MRTRATNHDEPVTRTVSRWRRHPVLTAAGCLLLLTVVIVVFRAVGTQQSVARTRAYWSEPQGEPDGLLYVALGDSAAQGVGASSPDKGYVGLLAERLRTSTGRPVQVVNLSVSGARVADVVEEQLPQLEGLEPDLVTVAIGGNDVRRYETDRFAADVDRLVAGLPPGTYVADVPYFMHGRWETDSAQAAGTVRTAAGEAGLVVVPLNDRLRAEGFRGMFTQTSGDLFHPNDRGYEIWTDAFWTEICRSSL